MSSFSLFLFSLSVALAQGINELSFFPIITFHPESGVHEEGTSVTLRCQASNANLPIQFTHNGALIDEDDPGFATGLTSYSIRSLNSNFEGEYVCLARNQIGNRTFTVASAPAFIQLQGTCRYTQTCAKKICVFFFFFVS